MVTSDSLKKSGYGNYGELDASPLSAAERHPVVMKMTEKEAKKTLLDIAKTYADELGYGKRHVWHEGVHFYIDDLFPDNVIWMRPDRDDGYAGEYILEIKCDGISTMLSVKKSEDGWVTGCMETQGDRGFQMLTDMYKRFKGYGELRLVKKVKEEATK